MEVIEWDNLRKSAIEETPEQWCITINQLERRMGEHGFKSLKDFITTPYSSGGLGIPLDKAIQFIDYNPAYEHQAKILKEKLGVAEQAKGVEVLGEHGGDNTQGSKTENSTLKDRGNKYRIAKLKRDHPEVAQRLMDGEFKSVSAAERAAGIGKPLKSNVEKVFAAILRLTPEEQDELKRLL